jgi:diaminopimelate decarboxylase
MSRHGHDPAGLVCEQVPIASIVDRVGTPVYIYSNAAIRSAYEAFDAAFAGWPHAVHYALKANSTLAIARLLRALGSGADANSGGEIEVALRAGFRPGDIVFSGVGKTPEELERAVAADLKAINVESRGEVERLAAIAHARGTRARVAVRVNPDIEARTHPHISTGSRVTKFGVPADAVPPLVREIAGWPGVEPVGLHVHVGSQILDPAPLALAAGTLGALAAALRADGIPLEHLDLGGGVGISYDGAPVPGVAAYAAAILPVVRACGLPVLLEPGRVLVGPAGLLVGRVVDVKEQHGTRFVVLDTGMTELVRPALYGAFHRIEPVCPRTGPVGACDVVGPLCETSDTLGRARPMPPLEPGDLLAVRDAGAYGSVMASNYNRRLLPPEVLVDGDAWRVIRRRQTLDDILALEA